MVSIHYYNSPIGILEYQIENNQLISLKKTEEIIYSSSKDSLFSMPVNDELEKYFHKELKRFSFEINPQGTVFQKKVWAELIKIPYGECLSYEDIAEKLGNKNLCRAVGQACRKNPVLIVIPCHRVIGKNNTLTGFAAGLECKKYLIDFEKNNCLNTD